MRIHYHVMSAPGPIGLLFIACTDRGIRYLEFLDRRSIKRLIATHEKDETGTEWIASLLEVKPVAEQLEAYFHGSVDDFDLPLDPIGSEFQFEVWNELRQIPYGETRSYGAIAKAIGQPRASRAVGLANNQNPIAIVVPCHRVIGSAGDLTGYGGGMPRKRWLLEHERRFSRAVVLPGEITATLHVPKTPKRPPRRAEQLPLFLKTSQGRASTVAARPGAPKAPAPKAAPKKGKVAASARRKSAPTRRTPARRVAARSTAATRSAVARTVRRRPGAAAKSGARATARRG